MNTITATSNNFNCLQALRGTIKDTFEVSNVKWGGFWNGMNWENFSFSSTPETLAQIKSFCNANEMNITFN